MDSSRWIERAKQYLIEHHVSPMFVPKLANYMADFVIECFRSMVEDNVRHASEANEWLPT